jgi:4-hydroxy-tetrahydrodipicolinate synthase
MNGRTWAGCGTALVTPFAADGSVDEAGVRRLTERQITEGVHFLVPCGTTGESPTLSEDEKVRIIEVVVEVAAGRVPVLAGAGGYDTRAVIRTAKRMKAAGADGLLSVTPYYNKPSQEGLYQHYAALAGEVGLPTIVYNVPGRTGCNVDVQTLVRLAAVDGIVGVKEASGNMAQIVDVRGAVPRDFAVLSGDDALTLPVMSIGGDGVISVAANEVPHEMVQMVELAGANSFLPALELHLRLLPLFQVNFIESNPGPVKFAMVAMGLLDERFRLPLVPPREAAKARILAVLEGLGLVAGASAA